MGLQTEIRRHSFIGKQEAWKGKDKPYAGRRSSISVVQQANLDVDSVQIEQGSFRRRALSFIEGDFRKTRRLSFDSAENFAKMARGAIERNMVAAGVLGRSFSPNTSPLGTRSSEKAAQTKQRHGSEDMSFAGGRYRKHIKSEDLAAEMMASSLSSLSTIRKSRNIDELAFLETSNAKDLEAAVAVMLRDNRLTEYLVGERIAQLPMFMRKDKFFGEESRENIALEHSEFKRWNQRCSKWINGVVKLRDSSVSVTTETLEVEKQDAAQLLLLAAQNCPKLHTLSLRFGKLSDNAIADIAIAMRGRLRSLDLHGTRGFGDKGIKALAAFCPSLRSLRLGGCLVTDEGIHKVAEFCESLRNLEVTQSAAVGPSSLRFLHSSCSVERVPEPDVALLWRKPVVDPLANAKAHDDGLAAPKKDADDSPVVSSPTRRPRGRGSVFSMFAGTGSPPAERRRSHESDGSASGDSFSSANATPSPQRSSFRNSFTDRFGGAASRRRSGDSPTPKRESFQAEDESNGEAAVAVVEAESWSFFSIFGRGRRASDTPSPSKQKVAFAPAPDNRSMQERRASIDALERDVQKTGAAKEEARRALGMVGFRPPHQAGVPAIVSV